MFLKEGANLNGDVPIGRVIQHIETHPMPSIYVAIGNSHVAGNISVAAHKLNFSLTRKRWLKENRGNVEG